jgi:hypothetical protein
VITLPILFILYSNQRKAFREGLLIKEKSGRTFWHNVNFFFWEFDGQSATFQNIQLETNLLFSSHWAPTRLSRIRALPIAILAGYLSNERLGLWDDPCDARRWHFMSNRLRPLREISIEEIFHPILSSEGAIGGWGMFAGNVSLH